MSEHLKVSRKPYTKAWVIMWGFIALWVLTVVFSINYAHNQTAAAIARINVGDRTRIYQESWVKEGHVKELYEELGGPRANGKNCFLSFGDELEVVGVHESRVLLRKLDRAGAVAEACSIDTIFFASSGWYLATFHKYDEEFDRRQKRRAQEEESLKIIRNLLLAEEAIKHK